MYQNYIFDLYGTLLDIQTNESIPSLWNKMAGIFSDLGASYSPKELKATYKQLCNIQKSELTIPYGEISLVQVFTDLFNKKGIIADSTLISYIATTFRVLSRKYLCVYDGIFDLLDTLKDSNRKIYLLSNAQSCFTLPELIHTGLFPYFDGIAISSDVGMGKPNIEFFNYLLSKYQLNISDSIMIGNDRVCDIGIAKTILMDSLYIHSNISPSTQPKISATYEILDGNCHKIKGLLLK